MIELKTSEGKMANAKKIRVTTSEGRAEAVSNEELSGLAGIIVDGQSFVLSVDGMSIVMQPVKSSNIAHLGWFEGDMLVTFKGKELPTLYGYDGVSDVKFLELVNADSIGRRFGLMKSECLKSFVRFF